MMHHCMCIRCCCVAVAEPDDIDADVDIDKPATPTEEPHHTFEGFKGRDLGELGSAMLRC